MRCALISDIHSNKYALAAVAASIRQQRAEVVINAGDTFGYYAWPQEVFELLQPFTQYAVLGNHDSLILSADAGDQQPEYGEAIKHNRQNLTPAAMAWLQALPITCNISADSYQLRVVHGSPVHPLDGRIYPDSLELNPAWLPRPHEVLVMGHTHYPMVWRKAGAGLVLNSGSVGQPRDGDPRASWMLFDTDDGEAKLFRVDYDRRQAMNELLAQGWNDRSIRALNKTRPGPLECDSKGTAAERMDFVLT